MVSGFVKRKPLSPAAVSAIQPDLKNGGTTRGAPKPIAISKVQPDLYGKEVASPDPTFGIVNLVKPERCPYCGRRMK